MRISRVFRAFAVVSSIVISGAACLQAQVPALAPVVSGSAHRPDFLKDLTLDSFGYDLSPNTPGFEGSRLSEGNLTAHGLECPYCTIMPLMNRSRFALQPFGSEATLHMMNRRAEVSTGFGGVEAWLPDGSRIPNRRSSSFNDAWLIQGQANTRFAIDPGRHFWLGATGRYLERFGSRNEGRTHWNTFGASAGFRFGKN